MRPRVAILISGRGSNMAALLRAAADPSYPAEIALVLSNRADAGGLAVAQSAGVPVAVVESRGRAREAFEAGVQSVLAAHRINIVALAGFLRVLTEGFVRAWEGRMVNIHPSLLPSFPGLDTHRRAIEAGVRLHGCTVHLVSSGVDEGPILAQAAVPVLPGDDEGALAARVLEQEHRLYPAALAWLASGRVRVQGGRAVVDAAPAEGALANPLPGAAALSTQPETDRGSQAVAEQKMDVELVEVKAEDIMAERTAMYDAFMKSIPWGIGATVGLLVVIYLIWG